ncbi:MAG: hypothetical protein NWP69_10100, partial [Congregibacter sp.]|nr:hypothetical protein [Congregibacter sp.]
DAAGGLLKHIIDQSLVEEWREDAVARLAALEGGATGMLDKPVALSFGVNNAGYTGTVTIAEPALEILWNTTRGTGATDPRST